MKPKVTIKRTTAGRLAVYAHRIETGNGNMFSDIEAGFSAVRRAIRPLAIDRDDVMLYDDTNAATGFFCDDDLLPYLQEKLECLMKLESP